MYKDILELQRLKKLFKDDNDPRPYSEQEVQEMGAKLTQVWSQGRLEEPNRHGVNYQGKS